MAAVSDAIDAYLAELQRRLRGDAEYRQRVLAEAEAHLRDAQQDLVDGGAPAGDAAASAVVRFGPAAEVARAFRPPPARRWRRVASSAVEAVATALVALGLSGVILLAMDILATADRPSASSVVGRLTLGLVGLALVDRGRWAVRDGAAEQSLRSNQRPPAPRVATIAIFLGVAGVLLLAERATGGTVTSSAIGVSAIVAVLLVTYLVRGPRRLLAS